MITRKIADEVIGGRLVNISSNTLTAKAPEFTTLSTLYDSIDYILTSEHRIDKSNLPDGPKVKLFTAEAMEVWTRLATSINIFSAGLLNKEDSGDDKRREIRGASLLGKPMAQLVLVRAFMQMKAAKQADGAAYSEDEICKRLNSIDWSLTNNMWQEILMHGDKIMSGKTAISLATDFVLYFAGVPQTQDQKDKLLNRYKSSFPTDQQDSLALPPVPLP